jgi:amino acid adenylation domain-containing protein
LKTAPERGFPLLISKQRSSVARCPRKRCSRPRKRRHRQEDRSINATSFAAILADLRAGAIDRPQALSRLRSLRSPPAISEPAVAATDPAADAIAVIGMAGQFPGARDIGEFWRVLCGERPVPADFRLTEPDAFDPLFFRIAPREAEGMSRHQRLVLTESWKALEDAAIAPGTLAGSAVSLYVGAEPTGAMTESFTGSSDAIIASRLAYFLDLRGAALVVNTGCSSSATALHLACEALRRGETDLVLAGGVFANLNPDIVAALTRIGMVSPTHRCLTFDADADGTVLCEGVGMVVLKRLRDAVAAGDPVRGVIIASGMNQDGTSNGITAPNGTAQEELLTGVYRRFGVAPETITYIEAHGTGTALGDPIEANALIRAFRHFTDKEGFCRLGSAKSVIGHASAAAGVIGLIKILLCMEHRALPALAGFGRLNPHIDLAGTAFRIETTRAPWVAPAGETLTAGLSAFGHSGTNVHFVVRAADPPAAQPCPAESGIAAVPLSARTPAQLRAAMIRLHDFLRAEAAAPAPSADGAPTLDRLRGQLAGLLGVPPDCVDVDEPLEDLGVGVEQRHQLGQVLKATTDPAALPQGRTLREIACLPQSGFGGAINLADVAFTLQHGRDHRETRAVFLAKSLAELLDRLEERIAGKAPAATVPADTPTALAQRAERWLSGADGLWALPPPSERPRRLHLPCYPFAAGSPSVAPVAPVPAVAAPAPPAPALEAPRGKMPVGPIMFTPVWEKLPVEVSPVVPGAIVLAAAPGDGRAAAICCACPEAVDFDPAHMPATGIAPGTHFVWLAPPERPAFPGDDEPSLRLLTMVRGLLAGGAAETPLVWTIVTCRGQATHPAEAVDPHQAAVHGLAATIAKECPNWRFRVVDMDPRPGAWSRENIRNLFALPADRRGRSVVARSIDEDAATTGLRLQWRRQVLAPLQPEGEPSPVYRRGGTYIVIGGAGDVGRVWTEHAIRSAGARVVWVGRRPENEQIRAAISRLGALGPAPVYLSADATDAVALAGVRDETLRRFGRIDGVIHSALDFFERAIAELDDAAFLRGFLAKALSATRIAEVFAGTQLDFVAMFSSVVSQIRNPRQGAYAAGCAFADALAHELNRLWSCPVRTINWGYWSSTKDQVADESAYRAFLRLADIGLGLIEPAEGMRAFDWLLAGPLGQIGIVKTSKPVEIEGLDPGLALRLPPTVAAPAGGLDAGDAFPPLDVARLRGQAEIAGLEPLLLALLEIQLAGAGVLAGTWRPLGTHLDSWAAESLRLLEAAGAIERDGAAWRSRTTGDAAAGWRAWQALRGTVDHDPARDAQMALAEAALRALPDMLLGRCKPTDVLFPNGSMRLVENVHRNNPVADEFHRGVAAAAMAALRRRETAGVRPARILEFGAGTGGTTSRVLAAFEEPANRDIAETLGEYTYTDISKAFLQHGEQAFARGRPFLRFRLLDIGVPPAEQGFAPYDYDLIIAANVLHATSDIRRTLRHAKTLLRPGGALLASEVSVHALFTHLTFGLLEGWWLAHDPELRMPGSPGLTPRAWRQILLEEGFPGIAFPLEYAHDLGQQVILATSDGIVSANGPLRSEASAAPSMPAAPVDEPGAMAVLRALVAATLKMPEDELDPAAPLDRYGMDSILAVKLAEDLGACFDGVSSALVFEHQTVAEIAAHFWRTQPAAVARLLSARGGLAPAADQTAASAAAVCQEGGPAPETAAIALLRALVAATLKMPEDELDPAAPLDRYGMDSILAVKLAEDLGACFDGVSSALVFEHQTVAEIAAHFRRTQPAAIARLLARSAPPLPPQAAPAAAPAAAGVVRPSPPPVAAPAGISRTARADDAERIAVIGMSGRFPGAATTDDLWRRIIDGRPAVSELPDERWDQRQLEVFHGDASGFNTRGCYVDDIASFDPRFFGIAPAEARWMDPRQRLFLEESWHAFEDAATMGERLRGSNCAVYVGVEEGEYGYLTGGRGQISSNQIASLAARIAYVLDLQGPNFALSAACSSGLVAIHQACQALRAGECDLALAGGVSLMLSPLVHLGLAHGQMLSPLGECRVFDAGASGMVPGDAVAAVVLKRLSDAVRDHDRIYGCIRASGVNYDGKTMGLATPNPRSQARLVRSLYERAGISAGAIQVVLAHSVGSPLTDPVEVQALSEAYAALGAAPGGCALASIKPLIGHSFAASGVVSLIVMLLAMRHATMPGTHGFTAAHPRVRLDGGPFAVRGENRAWPRPPGGVRQGAIGTTGLSGTNAHAVVEEFIPAAAARAANAPHIFPFSARTDEQLAEVVRRFAGHLAALETAPLADVAYTLQDGREPLGRRIAFVAGDREELRAKTGACLALLQGSADTARGIHRGGATAGVGPLAELFNGAPGEAFVARLVAERDLDKLAQLWSQGCTIAWRTLHGDAEPGRVSLPGYPFARERYWAVDGSPASPASADAPPRSDAPAQATPRPGSGASDHAGAPSLADAIRAFLAAQLEIAAAEIADATHWRDYGVDSLIETRLTLMLEEHLGIDLTGREVFDHPTVAGLARYLQERAAPATPVEAPPETAPLLPLSEGQQGLWMLEQLHPGSADYNIPIAFRVRGPWNPAAFEQAVNAVYARFPILRSVFVEAEGAARCATLPPGASDFQRLPRPALDTGAAVPFLRTAAREPFDLAAGPLMRTRVWTGADGGDLVLMVIHHLVFDGASAVTFLKALWNAYEAIDRGEPVQWPASGAGYQDFVAWEQGMLAGERGQMLRKYWQAQLAGAPASLSLATDLPDIPLQSGSGGCTHLCVLDDDLAARLRAAGRRHGVRESALFLALYQALIARLARSLDPVIGLAAMVRPQSRFEASIGYFVNTLPIRQAIDPDLPFIEHARRLQGVVFEGLEHAAYPFPVLVRELSATDRRGETPVFQTVFAFQNFVPRHLKDTRNTYASVLPIEAIPEVTQEGGYPLALEVVEQENSFALLFKYMPDVWAAATIASLADSLVALAGALADAPERQWRAIRPPAMPASPAPDGDAAYDPETDIIAAFEAAARNRGDATAVILAGSRPDAISYQALNERAEHLAQALIAAQTVPGAPVGVCLNRSLDSVVVLLALLKCAIPYVPLDPQDGRDRLAGIVRSAGIECIVVEDATGGLFAGGDALAPRLLTVAALGDIPPLFIPLPVPGRSASAYIIFTSGTTGRPKGVVIERRSLSIHCATMRRLLDIGEPDRVLQFTPLHLDPSIEQILCALSAGATLVMRDNELWPAATFWDRVSAHEVTIADVTPTYLHELLIEPPDRAPPSLRMLVVGGEAFPVELCRRLRDGKLRDVTVVNAYGPTETTITSAAFLLPPDAPVPAGMRTVPIGRPLVNEEMLLLDEQGLPVAEGFPGEIYIGGAGVARGYLDEPDLTAARFVSRPGGEPVPGEAARFFRTGDLGRYVPGTGGLIECLGRLDRQAKIRGVRIELDEVASAIRACPGVVACDVATEADERGGRHLTAAVTFAPDADAASALPGLRRFLAARLPLPMIPTRVRMAGRADVAAPVLAPEVDDLPNRPYAATAAAIWREVLRVPAAALDTDFFDAGGHSLLAVRLLHRIGQALGVHVPLATFLRAPTLAALFRHLDGSDMDIDPERAAGDQPDAPVIMIHPDDGPFAAERVFADTLAPVPFRILRLSDPCADSPDTVEALAERYAGEICRQFPAGPYRLCGWSFGGVVAFEVARRLRLAGRSIGLLALLDAYTPQFLAQTGGDDASRALLSATFSQSVRAVSGIEFASASAVPGDGLEPAIALARQTGAIETEAEAAHLRLGYQRFAARAAAMDRYVPPEYPGDMLLVRAREEMARAPGTGEMAGWDRCCGGRIEIAGVNGDHFSMVQPAIAGDVARLLRNRLTCSGPGSSAGGGDDTVVPAARREPRLDAL